MTSKNALLIAGTGAIGTSLAKALARTGYEVTVTSRREMISQENKSIRYVKGNAFDKTFLKETLEESQYDLIVDFLVYREHEFEERVELMLTSTKHYIFISSSRVYAQSDSPITEESPRLLDIWNDSRYTSGEEYAIKKAKCENLLFTSNKRNWTIVRPYITYSPNRLQLGVMEKESWLYRALRGRSIVFSKDISDHFTTMTHGDDVAQGIASIAGRSEAHGEVFNITTNECIKWEDVLTIYSDVLEEQLGLRPKIFWVDECPNRRNESTKWQVEVDRMYDRIFDNKKISHFVDTSRFVSTKVGLRDCLETFMADQSFLPIWHPENVLFDCLSGELSRPCEFDSFTTAVKYYIKRFVYPLSKL